MNGFNDTVDGFNLNDIQNLQQDANRMYLEQSYTIIPNLYGFGTDTRAAYGGAVDPIVLHVDTLVAGISNTDSTHGSFEWALHEDYPRVIVFDVSGLILMSAQDKIEVTSPYVTIAGQTAPGNIAFKGRLGIYTSNVLVQHMAVRCPGDAVLDDAIGVGNWSGPHTNIVVDHCSTTWATDEGISFATGTYTPNTDITYMTISNCIIAEGLEGHSKGTLLQGNFLDMTKNLYVSNNNRFPSFNTNSDLAVLNNVVHNFFSRPGSLMYGGYDQGVVGTTNVSHRGHVARWGPNSSQTADNNYIFDIHYLADPAEVLNLDMSDNIKADGTTVSGNDVINPAGITVNDATDLRIPPNYVVLPSSQTYDTVLANAGARPAFRDETDTRLVSEVVAGTGAIPVDVPDPFPTYEELTVPFVEVTNPHDIATGETVYTNLEKQLHALAESVE